MMVVDASEGGDLDMDLDVDIDMYDTLFARCVPL